MANRVAIFGQFLLAHELPFHSHDLIKAGEGVEIAHRVLEIFLVEAILSEGPFIADGDHR